MMDKKQLKQLIQSTLKDIGLYSDDAVNLILGTIAQESAFGKYIKQLGNGPALGICQMEPNTYNCIVDNYLFHKMDLASRIEETCQCLLPDNYEALQWNLKLSICMCRVHYLRKPEALPNDLAGYAAYWKKHYNTYLGAGTKEEYINNYNKYISNK